jgi:hypothetical protein
MWKLSNKIRVIVVAQNSLPMILIEVEFDDNAFINGFSAFLIIISYLCFVQMSGAHLFITFSILLFIL